ncbi:putative zinc finger, RING/FYVE/PHD-type containing protein [Tanacetum coccineum]
MADSYYYQHQPETTFDFVDRVAILNHIYSCYYLYQPQTTFDFVDEVAILNHSDSYYYPHQPQTMLGFVDEVAILNHIDSYYDEVVILNHILPYHYPRQPQNHMFPASPHSHIMHDILMNNPDDAFPESSFIVSGLGLEDMHHALGENTSRNSGSDLSEETILEHLQVITPKAKFGGENKGQKEEIDTCAICISEYEENKKIGKMQCGHLFHVDCIKSWLSRKNSCPMCRATALTV